MKNKNSGSTLNAELYFILYQQHSIHKVTYGSRNVVILQRCYYCIAYFTFMFNIFTLFILLYSFSSSVFCISRSCSMLQVYILYSLCIIGIIT